MHRVMRYNRGRFQYPVCNAVVGASKSKAHLGRLVGHLDSILQDIHWELGAWVTSHPKPEIGTSLIRLELLADLIQRWHPTWRQVAVLLSTKNVVSRVP